MFAAFSGFCVGFLAFGAPAHAYFDYGATCVPNDCVFARGWDLNYYQGSPTSSDRGAYGYFHTDLYGVESIPQFAQAMCYGAKTSSNGEGYNANPLGVACSYGSDQSVFGSDTAGYATVINHDSLNPGYWDYGVGYR